MAPAQAGRLGDPDRGRGHQCFRDHRDAVSRDDDPFRLGQQGKVGVRSILPEAVQAVRGCRQCRRNRIGRRVAGAARSGYPEKSRKISGLARDARSQPDIHADAAHRPAKDQRDFRRRMKCRRGSQRGRGHAVGGTEDLQHVAVRCGAIM